MKKKRSALDPVYNGNTPIKFTDEQKKRFLKFLNFFGFLGFRPEPPTNNEKLEENKNARAA